MATRTFQRGFTLVELAIVLVIIGLIVSSVLVGQNLIKAAELKATVRQYQQFQTAVSTFLEKYSKIPGDIDGDAYGLPGGCNGGEGDGDEDSLIEDTTGGGTINTHDGEIACFWANLGEGGLGAIAGKYDGTAAASNTVGQHMPAMKFGNKGWGVFNASSKHYFVTGVISASASNSYDTAVSFTPLEAYGLDSKIDDGTPSSGSVVTVGAGTANPNTTDSGVTTAGATVTTECYINDTTPTTYSFAEANKNCNLRFNMDTF